MEDYPSISDNTVVIGFLCCSFMCLAPLVRAKQ